MRGGKSRTQEDDLGDRWDRVQEGFCGLSPQTVDNESLTIQSSSLLFKDFFHDSSLRNKLLQMGSV